MIRSLGVKFLGEGSQTAKIRSLLQAQVLVILPTALGKLML